MRSASAASDLIEEKMLDTNNPIDDALACVLFQKNALACVHSHQHTLPLRVIPPDSCKTLVKEFAQEPAST